MEHITPETSLAVFQAILRELILVRDPKATFVTPLPLPDPSPELVGIGSP